jgi:hypothetical protein
MMPKKIKIGWIICVILCGDFFISSPLYAQYFGTDAFQTPIIGWMGFDTTAGSLVSSSEPWPVTDQLQFGFGYMHALVSCKLWYILQSAVGFGYAKHYEQLPNRIIVGLNASSGLRYNSRL